MSTTSKKAPAPKAPKAPKEIPSGPEVRPGHDSACDIIYSVEDVRVRDGVLEFQTRYYGGWYRWESYYEERRSIMSERKPRRVFFEGRCGNYDLGIFMNRFPEKRKIVEQFLEEEEKRFPGKLAALRAAEIAEEDSYGNSDNRTEIVNNL